VNAGGFENESAGGPRNPVSQATLAKLLIIAAIVMCAAVELSVRFAVDPRFQTAVVASVQKAPQPGTQPLQTSILPSLLTRFDDHQFITFVTLNLWVVLVTSGIGTELIVGAFMVKHLTREQVQRTWEYVQFMFPLFAFLAFIGAGHQSPFAIPFVLVGLWKFGFPETVGYLSKALDDRGLLAFSNLLNGLGTFLHHSSAALLICILAMGLAPLTRPMTSCILPLILQHLVVLVKYQSFGIYCILEVVLDTIFQWECLFNAQLFYGEHGMPLSASMPFKVVDPLVIRSMVGMFMAHWLYLLAAALSIVHGWIPEKAPIDVPSEQLNTWAAGFALVRAQSGSKSTTRSLKHKRPHTPTDTELLWHLFNRLDTDRSGVVRAPIDAVDSAAAAPSDALSLQFIKLLREHSPHKTHWTFDDFKLCFYSSIEQSHNSKLARQLHQKAADVGEHEMAILSAVAF
jgi:hypothetical protein